MKIRSRARRIPLSIAVTLALAATLANPASAAPNSRIDVLVPGAWKRPITRP